ncbi:hypothetical protein NHX12_026520 [Muraenolepis orangiensis]|uniref:E3 ubiquitin-protein ligase CHFR n=1 Tax=Muraenolepis orangiensis TaxID=630683 RepID=A0A9Q0EGN0_9TELE|nr:hypothetical protein NHX12_026520 [Muraenolepis orangiensis]
MESSAADAEDSAEFDAWCLTRVGSNVDWLYLMDNTEITVGRGLDVMYQLISPTCPLMISRLHCVFRQQGDGHWTVTDKKSLNGVWLNGQRIPAERAHPLQLGDAVHLGVAVAGAKVEYQYIFVRRPLKDVKPHLARVTTPAVTNAAKRKFGLDETEPSTSSKPKLYRSSTPDTSGARPCPAPVAAVAAILISDDSDSSGDLDNLQMFNQNMIALWEHFSDAQKRVATLEGASQQGSPAATEAQVRELKGQLAALLVKIRHMETLGMSFSQTKRQLVGLKPQKMKQEEEVFKKQVVEALQEQSKVTLELAQFRQGFKERFLAKKEELEVTREKNEKARAQKEEVVTQMMENDNLQCVICSELFIQPYMLNCSHIFCLHCIGKWRKRKDECPICRQTIHSQTRCLPLDNFIDSMVETLCADAKARRQVLVAERKGERLRTR